MRLQRVVSGAGGEPSELLTDLVVEIERICDRTEELLAAADLAEREALGPTAVAFEELD